MYRMFQWSLLSCVRWVVQYAAADEAAVKMIALLCA